MTINNDLMTPIKPISFGHVVNSKKPIFPYWKQVDNSMCSESHSHPRGQFIFSSKGITQVTTKLGVYLVPSSQAFWCPPNVEHSLVFPCSVDIANLFIDPAWCVHLPKEQQVMNVSSLVRELILRVIKIDPDYLPHSKEYRLMEVIIDEIAELKSSPLVLPWTENKPVSRIMSQLLAEPTNHNSIEQWANLVHSTPRTLARLFKKEVNMTFTEWRMQVRIFYAIEHLHKGMSVTKIALDLGYSTPSAFIAAFRKALGKSPLEYISQ